MLVYVLTNNLNHKQYVGQTRSTPTKRVTALLWRGRHRPGDSPIGSAIYEFGRQNFSAHIIAMGLSPAEADQLETSLIQTLGTLTPHGYNISPGGQLKRAVPESTRAKLSQRVMGAEWRESISRSCKGRKLSPERLAKFLSYRTTPKTFPGESNPRAVLTWAKVREIRALYAAGGHSQQSLAEQFGVKQVAISRIIRNVSWKDEIHHIEEIEK